MLDIVERSESFLKEWHCSQRSRLSKEYFQLIVRRFYLEDITYTVGRVVKGCAIQGAPADFSNISIAGG